jgi:acetoin utilization deacetylase AcuC-like enzyme
VIEQFAPDWVLVSCGFDAHDADPLAELRLVESDYASMAGQLARIAPGRTVLLLEGGYDLDALRGSASATVRGLAGEPPPSPIGSVVSPQSAWTMLDLAATEQARFWAVK